MVPGPRERGQAGGGDSKDRELRGGMKSGQKARQTVTNPSEECLAHVAAARLVSRDSLADEQKRRGGVGGLCEAGEAMCSVQPTQVGAFVDPEVNHAGVWPAASPS